MPWHEFLVASSENTHYQSVARLWIVIKWNIVIVAFISSIYIVSCLNNKQHNTCDYGLNLTIKTWSRYIERFQIKSNQWYSNRQSAETRIWISSKSEGKIITNVTNSIYICHRRQLIFFINDRFFVCFIVSCDYVLSNIYIELLLLYWWRDSQNKSFAQKNIYASLKLKTGYGFSHILLLLCAQHSKRVLSHRCGEQWKQHCPLFLAAKVRFSYSLCCISCIVSFRTFLLVPFNGSFFAFIKCVLLLPIYTHTAHRFRFRFGVTSFSLTKNQNIYISA